MKNNILITTTNSVENASIEKYIELISSNVVIGANFFSDFAASFTDFFGGFSGTYQNKLQKLYTAVIEELKHKALNVGANAVVGLKIDFDEISGKGKSMFMVTAVGTAVKISYNQTNSQYTTDETSINVSIDELHDEITKRNIVTLLNEDRFPTQEQWEYLLNNSPEELTPLLLEKHLQIWNSDSNMLTENQSLLNNNISNYFRTMDADKAIKSLYSSIVDNEVPIVKIITQNKLFSPQQVVELINNNHISSAIQCLKTDKEFYSKEDLNQMAVIIDLLDKLPDLGKIDVSKGLLSKGKEKYYCPKGHSNDKEYEFCMNESCGLNIKGLTRFECQIISDFKLKVDSLQYILSNQTQQN